jgi:hypothetical protein
MPEHVMIYPANKAEKDVGLQIAKNLAGEDGWDDTMVTVPCFPLYLPMCFVKRIHLIIETTSRTNASICVVETDRDYIFGVIERVK